MRHKRLAVIATLIKTLYFPKIGIWDKKPVCWINTLSQLQAEVSPSKGLSELICKTTDSEAVNNTFPVPTKQLQITGDKGNANLFR